eukprot:scaffold1532_cov111-Skeletonema_dohrnii-CCMP3373.AAC.4
MTSTRAAANSTSSTKKKKSAAARFHAAEADEDDDDVEFDAVCGVCNEGPPKQKTRRKTQHDMMNWRAEVKSETPFRNYLDGESNCPECRTRIYKEDGGCKMITCTWDNLHNSGRFIYFCGHCGFLSPNGDPPKCPCRGRWDREAREAELEKPIDDDYEHTSTPALSRESKQSPSSSASSSDSDETDINGDSNDTDSHNDMKTASEADLTEDEDVSKEVPTSSNSDVAARANKQEPDTVASTVHDDNMIINETVRPAEVKSADIPVAVKVKTEVASSSTAPYFDEDMNVEDSATSEEKGGEEDDIAALIYQESQRRKREAAQQVGQGTAAPKKRRKVIASSTRKASAATANRANNASQEENNNARGGVPARGKRKSSEDEEEKSQSEVARKKYKYGCPVDGCTNGAIKGRVCIKHAIKQEPDTVGTIFNNDDTVIDETLRPQEVKSADNPVEVKAEVASSSNAPYDDDTDVEDSVSSKEKDGERDDTATLIYQISQRRKREIAEQEEECATAPKKHREASSTRKASAATARAGRQSKKNVGSGTTSKGKSEPSDDEEELPKEAVKKKYKYECSTEGCTNKGGVRHRGLRITHAAKPKRQVDRKDYHRERYRNLSSEDKRRKSQQVRQSLEKRINNLDSKQLAEYKRDKKQRDSVYYYNGKLKRRHKASSTRKASAATAQIDNKASKKSAGSGTPSKGKRKSSEDEEEQAQKKVAKKKRYECSAEGCSNQVYTGGVCKRHGAEVKLCISEGCTNHAKKGGVCRRHGARL